MIKKKFEINDNGANIKCNIFFNDMRNIENIILSCHGFCGQKNNTATSKLAEYFLDKYDNFAVIAFDWPCHGKDVRQKINLNDCDLYLSTVLNFINNDMHIGNIYLQATSFGGYLALKYISEHGNPFKKIALRCPAINMGDVLENKIITSEQMDELEHKKIIDCGYDRKIKIGKSFLDDLEKNDIRRRNFIDYADDIIIMHGTNDELIDFYADAKFCDDNVIQFIPIVGADHRFKDPAKMRECLDNIVNFYAKED